jgi:hypothetical protein
LRDGLHPGQIAAQMNVLASLNPRERELMIDLLVRVVQSNRDLARPGAARRRRGFREPAKGKIKLSSQTNGALPPASSTRG